MAKRVLFFTPFPTEETISDGMMQRVRHIDNCFINFERVYLNIRLVRAFKKKNQSGKNITIHILNLFRYFFFIYRQFKKSETVYIHSLYNGLVALPFLLLVTNKKKPLVILDIHGAVPEEQFFLGSKVQGVLYYFVEKLLLGKVDVFIHVTKSMERYYSGKYPDLVKKKHIIYSIKPGTEDHLDQNILNEIEQDLQLNPDDVVFIYSGSTQKWQNVELMFDQIKLLSNSKYKYIFLSGMPDKLKEIATSKGLLLTNMIFRNVSPSMLCYYYHISHYGFILRDDHVLNRVANPTKLTEYLTYGVIPIVKLEEIGDFKELGYEFLPLKNLDNKLTQKKSSINKRIAETLLGDFKDLAAAVFNESHPVPEQ